MKNHPYSLHHQQGVALIVVMLIVALVTILATQMSGRLQLNVARTINLKANNQAYWYALGAEQFAQSSLSQLRSLSGDNINLSQPWAQPFEYPIEGGVIKAELSDMQSCFNLNSIIYQAPDEDEQPKEEESAQNTEQQPEQNEVKVNLNESSNSDAYTPIQRAFHRLISNYIDDSLVTDTIRDSLIDWIDSDTTQQNYGAEDPYYESLSFPYLAANNNLSHVSEFRLINGVEEALIQNDLTPLQRVICVLPENQLTINVNTLTEQTAVVLSSLLGDDENTGLDIIDARPEEGFKDKESFLSLPEVSVLGLSTAQQQWFDVTSKYFKLNTTVVFQESQFRLVTIFKLEDDGVYIISREFGGAR